MREKEKSAERIGSAECVEASGPRLHVAKSGEGRRAVRSWGFCSPHRPMELVAESRGLSPTDASVVIGPWLHCCTPHPLSCFPEARPGVAMASGQA